MTSKKNKSIFQENKTYLITNKTNLNFLSNRNYSNLIAIVHNQEINLFTDPRYAHAKQECKNAKVWIYTDIQITLEQFLKSNKVQTIYYEDSDLSVSKLHTFKKLLKKVKFLKIKKHPIANARKYKTQEIINKIHKSQAINEKIYLAAKEKLTPGISEQEIANFIKISAIQNNCDISFEPIVGFAENSGNIHHSPTPKTLKKNDPVLIDMGVKYQNYCSDMTRVIPSTNNPNYMEHYHFLQQLVKNIENNFQDFKTLKDIDNYAREEYKKLKDNITLPHSLGHGIGLEVHEQPFFNQDQELIDGIVFTIEPGIYIPGQYGIRLENIYSIQKGKLVNLNTISF